MADKTFFLTVQQVADYFNVSTKTIKKAVKLHKFPQDIRIMSCRRWSIKVLTDWIKAQKGDN